jgi:hypothetical protein
LSTPGCSLRVSAKIKVLAGTTEPQTLELPYLEFKIPKANMGRWQQTWINS